MQGKLNEIDIRTILQLIELGQRTGELFVEAHAAHSFVSSSGREALGHSLNRIPRGAQSWFVFFLNGQIIYAGSSSYAGDSIATLSRLRDHLRRYKIDDALGATSISAIAPLNAPEYGYLWALLESRTLTPEQGRSILQNMVQETLFDLLSLHQGSFIFELGSALTPQLVTLEIAPLTAQIVKQVQEWKQFYPHIQSPEQCPVVADAVQLRKTLTEVSFEALDRWADGQTSLRQMTRYLNRDLVSVARAIYPYVRQGSVNLLAPPTEQTPVGTDRINPPRVVCIDDGATVRAAVEQILSQRGYEVTSISNPLKALSLVFQLKPDLILCDIAMPELDGYEICAMLRKSTVFRAVPIVMLTGKDGFIDRVRARMVGATDYLTKPFDEAELLMLIEKYVGLGDPDRPDPDQLLAAALEDELDTERNRAKKPVPPA
jgi:twitching motility two-component system response regulator PilG